MSDPNTETISSDNGYDAGRRGPSAWSGSPGARTTALTAAVALVLAGGVATAAYRGLQSPTDVMSLVPASAFAVAAVDLSLPGGQDDSLATFVDEFPGATISQGSGSTVDRLLRAMLRDSSDPHVDYDDDVKPWLGDHAAVAGWVDDGSPRVEFLLESTDDGAARDRLGRAMGPDAALVVQDGYAVISDTKQHAADALAAADTKSLADGSTFSSDLARLPDDEAAVAWVDGPAVKDVVSKAFGDFSMNGGLGPLGPLGVPGSGDSLAGRTVAGIHVTDDTAQLDLYQVGGTHSETTSSTRLTGLPDKTVAAIETGAPGGLVDAVTAAVKTFGGLAAATGVSDCAYSVPQPPVGTMVSPVAPDRKRLLRALRKARHRAERQQNLAPTPTPLTVPSPSYQSECSVEQSPPLDPLDAFTEATGLTIPDDLKTMLGDAAVLSYGGVELGGPPDIAIRSHPTDLAAAKSLADTLATHVAGDSPLELTVQEAGGDLIIATSESYAGQVAADGSLGDQETAQAALGDVPDEIANAGFIDLSRIWPLTGGGVDDNIRHLRAFGFWSAPDDGALHTQLRLVVG